MRQSTGIVLTSFISIFLGACQSVYVSGPVPSVDSPEIRTPKRFSFDIQGTPAGQVVVAENAGSRPPDLGKGEIHSGYELSGALGYAPTSRILLKAGGFGRFIPTGIFLKSQFQLMGADQDSSSAGDASLSLSTEAKLQSVNVSGDQESIGGPGHRNWNGKGGMSSLAISLSYGYRTSKKELLFLGAGYGIFKTNGRIEQSETDTDPAASYDIPDRSGNTTSVALGYDLQRSETTNFIAKIVYYHINHDQMSLGRAGIELGAFFR